jgi:hypothetical protein
MTFTDVTGDAGVLHDHVPPESPISNGRPIHDMAWMGPGAAAEDFDGDGWIDLFAVPNGGEPLLLYINQGDGTFTDQADLRGVAFPTLGAKGVAAADFDNDGDIDVCVALEVAPHLLFINQGDGNFILDQDSLTVPSRYGTSPSFGDVDNDGFLELALGNWNVLDVFPDDLYLYKNTDGTTLVNYDFRRNPGSDVYVFSPRFTDLNGDRLSDLPNVCDFERSQLYINDGDGLFVNTTAQAGTGSDENGMGSAIGDYDNDGDLDWFVSSIWDTGSEPLAMWEKTGNRLYRNRGDGTFEDVTTEAGVRDGSWGWGSAFGDLDNDGDLDLYHVNGWPRTDFPSFVINNFIAPPARLFENLGDGTFQDIAVDSGAGDTGQGRGTILFDYDNDGDLDIFNTNNQVVSGSGSNPTRLPGAPVLLRNDSGNDNHWLKVRLQGIPPLHRDGIGSWVRLTTPAGTQIRESNASTQYMSQGPGRIAHFGLGLSAVADEVRAEWVTGDATYRVNVQTDREIVLPSPASQITERSVEIGEEITADGSLAAPVGNPRNWTIDGALYDDPAVVSFGAFGVYDLKLNVYEPDGTTLRGGEIVRVHVVSGVPSPTPTPTSDRDEEATPTFTPTQPNADFSGNGVIGAEDLLHLLREWTGEVAP